MIPDRLRIPADPLFHWPGLTDGWSFLAAHLTPEWDALGHHLTHKEFDPSRRRVDKRKREIIAGRLLARELMVAQGLPPQPLPSGADRAPVWPTGWTGSITHTDGIIALAFGPRKFGTIGIDIEGDRPLDPAVADRIALPGETAPALDLFVAKEAFYKAQAPQTGKMLGHHDVRLLFEGESFRAEVQGRAVTGQGALRHRANWTTATYVMPHS